jgi:sulfur carrier protein
MEILLNNNLKEVPDTCTIQDVLNTFFGSEQTGIAVAINETVTPKAYWGSHFIQPKEHITVITATQGG